ncbi:hypothetical protein SDC9_147941 [bioreactor metagenome]|uniref:Uncharacterized protein n=1 Tax=bioreactor metagenome TaxID=1076179 RepID=A0A645EFC6_9ZZZZ
MPVPDESPCTFAAEDRHFLVAEDVANSGGVFVGPCSQDGHGARRVVAEAHSRQFAEDPSLCPVVEDHRKPFVPVSRNLHHDEGRIVGLVRQDGGYLAVGGLPHVGSLGIGIDNIGPEVAGSFGRTVQAPVPGKGFLSSSGFLRGLPGRGFFQAAGFQIVVETFEFFEPGGVLQHPGMKGKGRVAGFAVEPRHEGRFLVPEVLPRLQGLGRDDLAVGAEGPAEFFMIVLYLHGSGQLLLRLPLGVASGKRRFSCLELFRVGDQFQCPLPDHLHLGDGVGHKPHGPPVEVVVNCEIHPAEELVFALPPGNPGSLGSPEK